MFKSGWYEPACQRKSTFFNARPVIGQGAITLLVIHNISLPAGNFTSHHVDDLFMGCLDCKADTSFASLEGVEVSAHFFIRRSGEIIQYVSCLDRAWHAGVSSWLGVDSCNDYSIGIELEGCDDIAYAPKQYQQLAVLSTALCREYAILADNIVGHCDIAPGRKTDPGFSFDWTQFRQQLNALL
ncbi:MAG: 1,6-anhydro-N-acetylmuramyl-L-alanine amidase AmpD [Sinobacterium sp.]|nr:1,6-anhydro-N-acetylmuramyl-L-alanine amidase AmpD [Sinobacterium sp.]